MTTAELKTRARVAHNPARVAASQETPMSTCPAPVTETAARILAHLQAQHAAGVATTPGRKLVLALGETPAAVKGALGFLVAQGKIEEVGKSVYGLAPAALPAPPGEVVIAVAEQDGQRVTVTVRDAYPLDFSDEAEPTASNEKAKPEVPAKAESNPPGSPRYAPAPGTVRARILEVLARPEAAEGMRACEVVRLTDTRAAEMSLCEMAKFGWVKRIAPGLYKLGQVPEPRPGVLPVDAPALGWQRTPGMPLTAAEQALTAELAQVREALRASPGESAVLAAERVRHQAEQPRPFLVEWEGRGTIVDAADFIEAERVAGAPEYDDDAEDAGGQVEATRLTAAQIKRMLAESTVRVLPVWEAVGQVAGTLGKLGAGWWGPVPADWPERLVTFIHATTADRDRLRGLANGAYNTLCNLRALLRLPSDANLDVEAPRIGADMAAVRLLVQARDGETLEAAVVRHLAKLDYHVETARESSRKAAAELGEARRGCERLRREAESAERLREDALMQRDVIERARAAREEHARGHEKRAILVRRMSAERDPATRQHLDAIRKALTEAGEPADLNDLLLAAAVRALVRQVKALEKVAQRQPVAPGPRILHPQEHPAVTAATVEAVGKLCCDACAQALDDLRDGLAIDEGATPDEVVSVVMAGRRADHARIGELRAELADTRRRLTVAACEARDLRAAAGRTLPQRIASFIGKVVG